MMLWALRLILILELIIDMQNLIFKLYSTVANMHQVQPLAVKVLRINKTFEWKIIAIKTIGSQSLDSSLSRPNIRFARIRF